ncbi:MAG: hypothetical protein WD802_10320 [Gemmatimonadaceae bacterium]
MGTTSNLYVVSAANVVYDITPTTVVGDGLTHEWQLQPFGTYLLATFARTSFVETEVINAFVWQGVPASAAIPAYDSTTGPGSVFGVAVTPERFVVLLRGADPEAWAPDTAEGGGGEGSGGGGDEGGGGGAGGGGVAPTETPGTASLVIVYPGRAVGTWANTNTTASIRAEWSISPSSGGPYAVAQTLERSPETTSDTYHDSSDVWARMRLQYFNATGAGPWSSYSSPIELS